MITHAFPSTIGARRRSTLKPRRTPSSATAGKRTRDAWTLRWRRNYVACLCPGRAKRMCDAQAPRTGREKRFTLRTELRWTRVRLPTRKLWACYSPSRTGSRKPGQSPTHDSMTS